MKYLEKVLWKWGREKELYGVPGSTFMWRVTSLTGNYLEGFMKGSMSICIGVSY